MEKKYFDFAILGGGPGGYVAAIRAAKSGKSVALIESKELGGTCLNRGCIPTKAHVANTDVLRKVKKAEAFGISTQSVTFEYPKMKQRVDKVVSSIVKGLSGLIEANKITVFKGEGKCVSPNEIKVLGETTTLIEAKVLILATGSEPKNVPAFPFDHNQILCSTSILKKETLPKSLVIIGGGVIGCEFASLYHELGVEITVLEALPNLIPMEAKDLGSALKGSFEKRGIKVHTGVKVQAIETNKKGVEVQLLEGSPLKAEWALVAVGRQLNTVDIGLEHTGISLLPNGAINVNSHMQTDVPHIYAIGDITAKWMLAHVASHQGVVAAEHALGRENAKMHYNAIPSIIFTYPEIASVGLSLEQAQAQGHEASLGKFPFQALGIAQAKIETEGFAQVVVDSKTRQILGAQIFGPEAASCIAELTTAIQNELTLDCIKETVHAHPTLPEAWLEAAFLADDMPIHLPPSTRKRKEKMGAK